MASAARPTGGTPVAGSVERTLRACPVFASLVDDALVRRAGNASRRSYDGGEVVFQRGERGDCLYVVARGSVEITVQDPDGGVALLAVIEPPEAFGELAAFDGGPRVASATARAGTELVRVPQATLARLVPAEPAVASALLASLVAMVRHGDEKVADLSLRRLHHRVRRHLLRAARPAIDARGAGSTGPVLVDLPINQTDLARQVGGSRQQVNRVLAALADAGAIQRQGRRIVAVRPDLLAFDD